MIPFAVYAALARAPLLYNLCRNLLYIIFIHIILKTDYYQQQTTRGQYIGLYVHFKYKLEGKKKSI